VLMTALRPDGSTASTAITGGAITARGVTGLAGAPFTVDLATAAGPIATGAITATTGNARVVAAGGAFTGSTVTTRTGFEATTGQGLTLTSFTVTAGGATLNAGTGLTLTTGTTTGNQVLTAGGNGSLGNLTVSAGNLTASSTGGALSFGALRASGTIGLSAKSAFTTGANTGYALIGTSLDGNRVNATAATGNVQVGTLTARDAASGVAATTGGLRITTINLLPRTSGSQLVAGLSGSRFVPTGY